MAAIIVISAVALAAALRASLGSLGGLSVAFGAWQAAASLAGADACVDEALLRLLRDDGYAGGTFRLGEAACELSVAASGNTRIIRASSAVAAYVRKVKVELIVGDRGITVTAWQEVAD